MKSIHCCIITIGDELLIGQTIDTNSAWIAQHLNEIGIWVKKRVAVATRFWGSNSRDLVFALTPSLDDRAWAGATGAWAARSERRV